MRGLIKNGGTPMSKKSERMLPNDIRRIMEEDKEILDKFEE